MASNQKVYKPKIAQHEILQKKKSEPNFEYDFFLFLYFFTTPNAECKMHMKYYQ